MSPEPVPHLSRLGVRVLLWFATKPGPHCGNDLIRDSGLKSGSVYPLLKRLNKEGLLEKTFEKGSASEKGRPLKTFYSVTEEGGAAARELTRIASENIRSFSLDVGYVLQSHQKQPTGSTSMERGCDPSVKSEGEPEKNPRTVRRLTVRLNAETEEILRKLGENRGPTYTEVIRKAVRLMWLDDADQLARFAVAPEGSIISLSGPKSDS